VNLRRRRLGSESESLLFAGDQFYSDVPATISNFDPIKGSREQEFWQHARCHHERGDPKLTIINVDEAVTRRQMNRPIAARLRWGRTDVIPRRDHARETDRRWCRRCWSLYRNSYHNEEKSSLCGHETADSAMQSRSRTQTRRETKDAGLD
jgi:hypothetical protein